MSAHLAFRRQPVPGQYAQSLKAITLPAPTRGIIQSENDAYTGPGACIISDNWFPTLKGVRLRGGTIRWCDLHALDFPAWTNGHSYTVGQVVRDPELGSFWNCAVDHLSAATGTFAADRAAHLGPPPYWTPETELIVRKPVISGFEYVGTTTARMYAAQATKLFDVTGALPVLIASGRTSGNYVAAQLANEAAYWIIAVNETGDPVLRSNDGVVWNALLPPAVPADGASAITGPVGSPVANGLNLSYVCKYRNRLFFIQTKSMSVWYLEVDAVGGELVEIPMSGAATRGGYLLFMANWTIDAGDGIDDKLVVVTSEGEALIWTGNDPGDSNNWRQEGRFFVGKPLGMNAHAAVGGDVLILTVEGIVPLSQTITKSPGEMELALVSRAIKRMWREEVATKTTFPWTIKRWDEYGGIFVTFPGGSPGNRHCLAMNSATGAFARTTGWDALCFLKLRENFYFGTQDGIIMQADRGGYDDANHAKTPYVATLVGGWETFQARSQTVVWHQARAVFAARPSEPFEPQLDSTTDYVVVIPPPPAAGDDPGPADVWDQGKWGPAIPGLGPVTPELPLGGPPPRPPTAPERLQYAQWDQPALARPTNRNTLWVSIGKTGFAHAPIVQVTVAQQVRPDVELVAIAATFEVGGVNV